MVAKNTRTGTSSSQGGVDPVRVDRLLEMCFFCLMARYGIMGFFNSLARFVVMGS